MKKRSIIPEALTPIHEQYIQNIRKVKDLSERVIEQNGTMISHFVSYAEQIRELQKFHFIKVLDTVESNNKTAYKNAYALVIKEVTSIVNTYSNFLDGQINDLENLNSAADLLINKAVETMLSEDLTIHKISLDSITDSNNNYCKAITAIQKAFEETGERIKAIPFLGEKFDEIKTRLTDLRKVYCNSLGPGKSKKSRMNDKIKKAFDDAGK